MKILIISLFALTVMLPLVKAGSTQLWYKQPAQSYDQSLVLGSGRMGAMVFGGVEQERIILNEESMWAGSRVEHNISGGYKHLPQIRKLLDEEKFNEAFKLVRKYFSARHMPAHGKKISPFGRYQVFGNLHLKFTQNNNPISDYRRELDLNTGLATVHYKQGAQRFTREHFVSAPDNVFVSRFSGPISFTLTLDRPERFTTTAVNGNELFITGRLNNGLGKDGLLYAGRLRVIVKEGSVKAVGNSLKVNSTEEVVLLFAAATNYQGMGGRQLTDPIQATVNDINSAAKKSFASLKQTQQADHTKFFNRVKLELGKSEISSLPTDERIKLYREGKSDPALEALFFNMGRYLLISSSRPGGLPANLQGIWAEEVTTMWNGDYHFNINVQMNYWPALSCNLIEMQEPLNKFIAFLVKPGTKTAKAYYNSRGWIAHRTTNVWGFTAPTKGLELGGPAWLCEHLWERYTYSLDKKYLAQVYPIMKGSVEFYLDNLWQEPENKWLVTGPTLSPENRYIAAQRVSSGICSGPATEMQLLRELFANVIRAGEILGVDQELQNELKQKRVKLAPNQISPDGYLQEWLKPYKEIDPQHRHCSPLHAVYPYYEISPAATPELAKAAEKLLERRGVGESTGWSNAWKINLWARLTKPEKAYQFVQVMLKDNTFDNLLSRMRPEGRKLFQIEANFGYTAGITEMLLQSQPDSGKLDAQPVIRLLPALPKAWKSGEVNGLKARYGIEVNMKWQNGKLVKCLVKPEHNLTGVTFRYNGIEIIKNLKQGKTYSLFNN